MSSLTYFRFIKLFLFSTLVLGLQSCGSSGSDAASGDTGQSEVFSDPVDTTTLRNALITGATSSDNDEFWQCAVAVANNEFAYRLFADGSGTETNLPNQDQQIILNWEAISESSLTLTNAVTSATFNFTNIQFSNQDAMMLISENSGSQVTCNRQNSQINDSTTTLLPEASNSVTHGSMVYPLTHGFEEAFSYRPSRGDTHSTSEFEVADAVFSQTTIFVSSPPIILWRPDNATVWLRADLHSPGGNGFETATFKYEPDSTDEQGPAVAGRFFFNEASFGIDTDENGSIDSEANEFFDIISGTITVNRMSDSVQMNFDVTLEDGVNVVGSFAGVFPLFEH